MFDFFSINGNLKKIACIVYWPPNILAVTPSAKYFPDSLIMTNIWGFARKVK